MNHHRQNGRHFFLLLFSLALSAFGRSRPRSHNIGQRRVLQDVGGSIAHVQKYLVEGAMSGILVDESSQLFGISKGSEGTVDQADDFAQMNLRRGTPQRVATFCSAD